MGFKVEEIERLIELVKRHGIQQLEVEEGGIRVHVVAHTVSPLTASMPLVASGPSTAMAFGAQGMGYPLGAPSYGMVPPPAPVMGGQSVKDASSATAGSGTRETPKVTYTGRVMKSPFVGTFYRAPSPGAENFVDVGKRVKKGETLCIVEAMKLMNEIESEFDGVIKEILVENEQPVEFDQPLFIVE